MSRKAREYLDLFGHQTIYEENNSNKYNTNKLNIISKGFRQYTSYTAIGVKKFSTLRRGEGHKQGLSLLIGSRQFSVTHTLNTDDKAMSLNERLSYAKQSEGELQQQLAEARAEGKSTAEIEEDLREVGRNASVLERLTQTPGIDGDSEETGYVHRVLRNTMNQPEYEGDKGFVFGDTSSGATDSWINRSPVASEAGVDRFPVASGSGVNRTPLPSEAGVSRTPLPSEPGVSGTPLPTEAGVNRRYVVSGSGDKSPEV